MKVIFVLSILILSAVMFSACGSKQNSYDSSCYDIIGDEVVYTCRNDTVENPRANTGYTGPYNPKALDLYRPGRYENLNSAPW